jgi:hypothetical protein
VREAKGLYETAMLRAWKNIEEQAAGLAARAGRKLTPVRISYDPLPGESVIDELPDLPKSSRPEAVPVSVRLRVTCRLDQPDRRGGSDR